MKSMKGKRWLAAGLCAAVWMCSTAFAAPHLTLPEAGLTLTAPEDWLTITADTVDDQALAALGAQPEVVLADMQASDSLALWYAPDLEARLVVLGEAAAESVWTADLTEKDALAAQVQELYPGRTLAWADDSWLTLAWEESLGGLTAHRQAWITCQYGQLYALEAVRYGQPLTDAQQAEIAQLAQSTLALGRRAETAETPAISYPALEIPTWSGEAEVNVLDEHTAITLDNPITHLYAEGYVLTGRTEPNTAMRYYVNGNGVERFESDGEGRFATGIKSLQKGKNTVRVQAVGEKGYGTVTFPLVYNPVQTPVALNTVPKQVAEESLTLVGRTVPGASVTVYIGKDPFRAQMNEDGTFTVTVPLDKVKKYSLTLRAEHESYKRQDVKLSLTRVKNPQELAQDQLKKAKEYPYAKLREKPAAYARKVAAPQGVVTALHNSAATGPLLYLTDEAGQTYAIQCPDLLDYPVGLAGQALLTLSGQLDAEGLPLGELIAFFPSAD